MGVDASAQACYRRHLSPWPASKVTRSLSPPLKRVCLLSVVLVCVRRTELNRRHCHFSLSGVEAERGDRAAAEDDRRTGRGGKQGRAAAAALSDLFTPKARGLDQENTHRSPGSAFGAVSAVVLSVNWLKFPKGAPGRLLACGSGRLVSGPQKQMPGVADWTHLTTPDRSGRMSQMFYPPQSCPEPLWLPTLSLWLKGLDLSRRNPGDSEYLPTLWS